ARCNAGPGLEVERHDRGLEAAGLVRAVAERLAAGLAAAAERDPLAAAEAERLAVLVHELEVTLDPERAVAHHRDPGRRHAPSGQVLSAVGVGTLAVRLGEGEERRRRTLRG